MKMTFAPFSPRAATLAALSDRAGTARNVVTRSAMAELFAAELYGQRRF